MLKIFPYDARIMLNSFHTLQKLKYDIHTKLPLESYQIRFSYDSSGNLYEYHTSVFAVYWKHHVMAVILSMASEF